MKRKIITINEDLCNGCEACVVGCSEGALKMVNGKAKLVKEDFCDGFGDCIGACPTGALVIEEKESVAFDEVATKEHLLKTQGPAAVKKMEEAQKRHEHKHGNGHGHGHTHGGGGCPGSRSMQFAGAKTAVTTLAAQTNSGGNFMGAANTSELAQWPIQLHLVQPHAPFFKGKELVIMSTCAPLASADVHWRFLRGRSVVVACPKLDRTEPYAEKLAEIFKEESIPKVIIVRMEVPCCGGLTMITKEALTLSGRKDLVVEEHVVAIEGGSIRAINKI